MIVSFGKDGKLTVTAETSVENTKLFELVNGEVSSKAETETEDKPKRKYAYKKRTLYLKSCPVEGCEHKAKGMDLHLRNKHGILPDGSIVKTFTYNGASRSGAGSPQEKEVSMPVVKTENGYRLKNKSDEGLLGHTNSFAKQTKSVILG